MVESAGSVQAKPMSKGRRQYNFTGIHSIWTRPSVYNEENGQPDGTSRDIYIYIHTHTHTHQLGGYRLEVEENIENVHFRWDIPPHFTEAGG